MPIAVGATAPDAIRFRAFARPAAPDAHQSDGSVQVTRVNEVFMLGSDYSPGTSMFHWIGSLALSPGAEWSELPFHR